MAPDSSNLRAIPTDIACSPATICITAEFGKLFAEPSYFDKIHNWLNLNQRWRRRVQSTASKASVEA